MGQLFAAILFSVLVAVVVVVLLGVIRAKAGRKGKLSTTLLAGLVAGLLVFLAMALISSYTVVQAGSVAVVKRFGEVVTVFEPGLNWKIPFIDQTVVYRTQEIVYDTSSSPSASKSRLSCSAMDSWASRMSPE